MAVHPEESGQANLSLPTIAVGLQVQLLVLDCVKWVLSIGQLKSLASLARQLRSIQVDLTLRIIRRTTSWLRLIA